MESGVSVHPWNMCMRKHGTCARRDDLCYQVVFIKLITKSAYGSVRVRGISCRPTPQSAEGTGKGTNKGGKPARQEGLRPSHRVANESDRGAQAPGARPGVGAEQGWRGAWVLLAPAGGRRARAGTDVSVEKVLVLVPQW